MGKKNRQSANKHKIVKEKVNKKSGTLDQYKVKLTPRNEKKPMEEQFSVEDIANFDNNNKQV